MKAPSFKSYLIHIIAIIIFAMVSMGYFQQQFQGKKIQAGDNLAWLGASKEIKDFEEKTGDEILWTNAIFGGMPAYQIGGSQRNNLFVYVKKLMSFGFARPIGLFILGMICFYILMLTLKINPWLAILGSISFAFMTNNLVLLEAGHMTKVTTIMVSPLVIAGVLLTYRRNLFAGGLLFTFGMAMNLMANHVQMTYYLAMILSIYVIIKLVAAIKEGSTKDFVSASAVLMVGLLLAVGANASKLWTTYEYSKDTMRGTPILSKKSAGNSSSDDVGLDWEYAMSWSNGFKDLIPSYIPLAVGGSSAEPLPKSSEFAKDLRKKGGSTRGMQWPLYWGELPFTSGPIYFGAIIFFLFVFSSFYLKGPFKWWIVSSVIFTFLLSMGKNFEILSRIFFDFFPMYNKFRTPNSILSVTAIIIPLLAIYGLDRAFKDHDNKDRIKKILFATAGSMGMLCIVLALLGGAFFDFTAPGDQRLISAGLSGEAIVNDRISALGSSAFRSLILTLIAAAGIFAFIKSWLDTKWIILLISLAVIFDQFGINLRYVNGDSFVKTKNFNQNFALRDVDKQILKDTDVNYRVFDTSINTFNSNQSSYHHKTIGGYHAAKLQRYQDLIDNHISKNNTSVLNMLNTKYFIGGQGNKAQAQQNPAALGNAWFINNINMVNSADEEIAALTNFDPAGDAIIHKEFKDYIGNLNPVKSGTIKLSSYRPDLLKYSSNSETEQLAVFSEIWYGPNKGWKAYIDGKEVDHIRANYALRALKVPAGNHQIEFVFKPKSYFTGETISLICSVLTMLLALFYGFRYFKSKNN